MPAKRFTKFGVKRDNNLSDIPNARIALNNILDGLKGSKESFVSEDLDCIRGIFPYNISASDFQQIANTAVKATLSSGVFDVFRPLITIENRFDRAYFTVSDPFFYGGDGPTTKYYDNAQIGRDGSGNFTGFIGDPVDENNFWERGDFVFADKLNSNNISLFGGIEWTGFYKPIDSGTFEFYINTDGFYTFEFNTTPLSTGGGTFTTYGQWTEPTKLINISTTSGSPVITFTNTSDMKYIMTNMTVSNGFPNDEDGNPAIVQSVDEEAQTCTMSVNANNTLAGSNVLFTKQPGTEGLKRVTINLPLEQFEAYPIRIRYFVDENQIPTGTFVSKTFQFFDIEPGEGGTNNELRYNKLYDEQYFDSYFSGDFKLFLENSVSTGGTEMDGIGTIGTTKTTTNGDNYREVASTNQVYSTYEPPKIPTDVYVDKTGVSYTNAGKSLSISSTDNIEIGNYAVGVGIPIGARVSNIVDQESVILDQLCTSTLSGQTVRFINHKGFVTAGTFTSCSGNTISGLTFPDDSRIREGQVVICSGYTGSNWARIISYDNTANTITTTQPLNTISSTDAIYIYYDSALVNQSLEAYCLGVYAKRVVPPAGQTYDYTYPAGTTQITLEDTTNLSNGMYAHMYPKVPFTEVAITGGTELRSSVTISITGNVVTLSQGLAQDLSVTSSVATNMTFTPTNVNKEICFVPSDTAPPFNATSSGLSTSQSIRMVQSDNTTANTNAQLTYNNLNITVPIADIIEVQTTSDSVSHRLPILDNKDDTYYMLLGS
jgi:hypothetical protein